MKGNLWAVIVVALFLALLLPAVNLGYQNTARTTSVANEAVTIDYSATTTVDAASTASTFHGNETITVDGATLTDGTDYRWNTSSGEIDWLNTTATSDSETAQIDYSYQYHGETTRDIVAVLGPWGTILGVFLLVTGLGYFVSMAYGGGGF